ncbi:hypothetical protein CASFOL_023517 [Castilleja foliolosa]|uniref:peroxidase n=1 Tax=Castilleja foliolosa TaxID=1961234 RepID=A0ABD3CKS1_9LAMI
MAFFPSYNVVIISLTILLTFIGSSSAQLHPNYYDATCPRLLRIVTEVLKDVLAKDPRMGASLLRLHFHDCFVNGCDGSVLLKDTSTFKGEQSAAPNLNSLRGFDVIDRIKSNVNGVCKNNVVSCADILALAARESVVQLQGHGWNLTFGRRDSRTASKTAAVNNLPSPTMDLNKLIQTFANLKFSVPELVALSGAHTIGQARCTNYRSRIYNKTNIDSTFAQALRTTKLPKKVGYRGRQIGIIGSSDTNTL